MSDTIALCLSKDLSISLAQTNAAISLLDEGATVPFIARYRKEKTQGLDDSQLRTLEERLYYLRELDKRRQSIIHSIEQQGKLSAELHTQLHNAQTKTELEDIYLPYKPKRRTKAQIAREAGLQKLTEILLTQPQQAPEILAKQFINIEGGVPDITAALEGAQHIITEMFSENAELMTTLRQYLWRHAQLTSTLVKNKKEEAKKFTDYFNYYEAIKNIPSHRALALFRGNNEGYLNLHLDIPVEAITEKKATHPCEKMIASHYNLTPSASESSQWLQQSIHTAWKTKLHLRLSTDLKTQLKENAEAEAIRVFANNLKDLLLAAPAGAKVTMGLDPGIRTGVKVVVIDATGQFIAHTIIYPHPPRNQWDQSIEQLQKLISQYKVELISIGNGTGSRETDKLISDLIKRYPNKQLEHLTVSEAGASVYSASALASQEFPDLDVSLRGAVSIARRLQDPLAELVKIEPKAIGVGQYQHDVNQTQLTRSLTYVVEDCVNAVGVDVNRASAPLLTHIAGLNSTVADNIVEYRNQNGPFKKRNELKKVSRLGPKAFEQSAGFLRIMNGTDPLDASSVHPESAHIVHSIAKHHSRSISSLIGDSTFIKTLKPNDYVTEQCGLPTIKDILQELEKPGRDPRPAFLTAHFSEEINSISDLEIGMQLEGVVSNVTNFGAFIDIGVHQDGLVHISQLADHFVSDPRDIVKAGDIVKVHVESIDPARKRIALSMNSSNKEKQQNNSKTKVHPKKPQENHRNSSMQDAFKQAKKR